MRIRASLSRLLIPVVMGAFFPALASGAECASPDLAPGYCDRDGNLVADPPDDKSQWLDPDPIILADVPTTDMTERAKRAEPFVRHMEKSLRRRVTYFMAKDSADLLAAFKANRVHLLNINTGGVARAVRCDGFVPLAQPKDGQGRVSGYQMEVIVPANSTIKKIEDLKGRKLTFVDERSASGYVAPKALLAKEFGLEAGRDYQFDFSGRQDNSIVGVANGLNEAAAIASAVKDDLLRDKVIRSSDFRIIYTSRTFPHSPWGSSNRLNPELAKKIRAAIVSYSGPDKVLQSGSRFKDADYKSDWAFVRDLNKLTQSSTAECKQ